MKLYRLSNDPKHVMWAVCGALLQGGADALRRRLRPPVARRRAH